LEEAAMPLRIRTALLALAGALSLAGCQTLVDLVTSPSDWISGTAESISASLRGLSVYSGSDSSGSGSGGGAGTAYREDVRAYAAEFAGTGGSSDDFLRGIGRVAESHGVSHWEGRADTLLAIGAGLRDAGLSRAEVEALAARDSGVDPRVAARLLEGYTAAE
jgi:hypothetical protein